LVVSTEQWTHLLLYSRIPSFEYVAKTLTINPSLVNGEVIDMYPELNRNFESNRILAGVGAVLTAVGSLVVFRGPIGITAIIGLILVLIATRGLAEDYKNHAIYRNMFNGFMLGLVGTFIAIVVFAAFDFLSGFIFSHPIVGVLGYLVAIGGWIVMSLFFLIAGVFFKQAFNNLAQSSRVGILRTGGLLLLVGGILTIILVGFFLLFLGWIFIAVGLFSLPPPLPNIQSSGPMPSAAPPNVGQVSGQAKYCPYCGAENKLDGTFCTHCGRRLNPDVNAEKV
jgi:uncharacterized membrane protein